MCNHIRLPMQQANLIHLKTNVSNNLNINQLQYQRQYITNYYILFLTIMLLYHRRCVTFNRVS